MGPGTQAAAVVDFEVTTYTANYTRLRIAYQDESVAFVAKPVRVRTRKGKDYHVLRVTIPKEVSTRLALGPDDYLVLRAKIAQWFHMVNWSEMPEVWERLPEGLRGEVMSLGLPNPAEPRSLPSPTSPAGLAAAVLPTLTGGGSATA